MNSMIATSPGVDLIPEWIEDASAQKQILVDNPRRLYRFS
jgi:predicted TIM-barrel fold metal-dependent hydrolase